MNSTTARARLLVALTMIGTTLSTGLLADSATAKDAYSVNLTVSDERPDVGELVGISGRVTPNAAGRRVEVQGRAAGSGLGSRSRRRDGRPAALITVLPAAASGFLTTL